MKGRRRPRTPGDFTPSAEATYNQRVIDKLIGEPTKQQDAVKVRRDRPS
jgi:hypothetical protein